MRWRRLQIVAVVVGVNMGLVWLLALTWRVLWLAYAAAAAILLAWVTILVFGMLAMLASRRTEPPEHS
jgi:hypothetical protein